MCHVLKTPSIFIFLVIARESNENLDVAPDSLNSLRLVYLYVEMDANPDASRFLSQCCRCVYKIGSVVLLLLGLVDAVRNHWTFLATTAEAKHSI